MLSCLSWAKISALLGFILLTSLPLAAQDTLQDLLDADQLRITARLDPVAPVIATQRAKLVVEIATPNWFTGGTKLGDLEVRNAIVLQRQTFGNNSSRRINGQTWAVQGWEFEIFPRYPGTYAIPGVEISVQIASGAGASIRGETVTEPLTLEAIAPNVDPPAANWVVSPNLSIRSNWDLPPTELTAGNARQRTIIITAEELPSMVLPAPVYPEIDGIGIYPQPARRDDQTNRGQSSATFTQTVSYFCEEAGTFTIPGFKLAWWNPSTETWQIAEIPADTFDVAANPNAVAADEGVDPASTPWLTFLKRFVIISVGLFALALIGRILRRALRRGLKFLSGRRHAEANSEQLRWRELQHALRGDDNVALIQALYQWRDAVLPDAPDPSLAALAQRANYPELGEIFNDLLQCRYAAPASPFNEKTKLTAALRRVRPALIRDNGVDTLDFGAKLDLLN